MDPWGYKSGGHNAAQVGFDSRFNLKSEPPPVRGSNWPVDWGCSNCLLITHGGIGV